MAGSTNEENVNVCKITHSVPLGMGLAKKAMSLLTLLDWIRAEL